MFVFGPAGVGKTTGVCQFPNAVIVDTERGTDFYSDTINKAGSVVLQTLNPDEIREELHTLLTEKHNFKTLIIDPIEASFLNNGTCSAPSSNEWKTPKSTGGNINAPGEGTSIDVINKIVFLGTVASDNKKNDFYVVDATDPTNIKNKFSLNTGYGINALDVITRDGYYYAFLS